MWDNNATLTIGQPPTIQDVVDLLKSQEVWLRRHDESVGDYSNRYNDFMNRYKHIVKCLGVPILKPNPDGTNPIVFSKDINIELAKNEAISRNRFIKTPIKDGHGNTIGYYDKWFCPYHRREEEYMMRVLNPKYPEGFIDKGGVLMDCLCLALRVKDKSKMAYKIKHPDKDDDTLASTEQT